MPSQLWLVLPYCAFLLFGAGHIWRYRHDRFRGPVPVRRRDRVRRLGLLLFQVGMSLIVIERVTEMVTAPHAAPSPTPMLIFVIEIIALSAAGAGAVMLLIPWIVAARRQRVVTWVDHLTLPVLAAALLSGVAVDYDPDSTALHSRAADTLFPWFRSLFTFHPQAGPMVHAPVVYQARALIILVVIAMWPFTRLAGVLSAPVACLTRRSAKWSLRDPRETKANNGIHSIPQT